MNLGVPHPQVVHLQHRLKLAEQSKRRVLAAKKNHPRDSRDYNDNTSSNQSMKDVPAISQLSIVPTRVVPHAHQVRSNLETR